MAEYPMAISASYDDVARILTVTATAYDTPPAPEGVREDLWYPQQWFSIDFQITPRRSQIDVPTALYQTPGEPPVWRRVTYSGGQWQMPGVVVPPPT